MNMVNAVQVPVTILNYVPISLYFLRMRMSSRRTAHLRGRGCDGTGDAEAMSVVGEPRIFFTTH
jgi:hypothetical protein